MGRSVFQSGTVDRAITTIYHNYLASLEFENSLGLLLEIFLSFGHEICYFLGIFYDRIFRGLEYCKFFQVSMLNVLCSSDQSHPALFPQISPHPALFPYFKKGKKEGQKHTFFRDGIPFS